MLGLGLDTWNAVMLWSLGGAALAAFAVVVSTTAILRLQKASEEATREEYERYKLTVEGQVADAKSEGLKAGETAGNALVRAAELEKDAADARLETERIKGVVAWRTILPQTAAKLGDVLKATPGSVNLRFTDGDPESLFLAIQFSTILGNAGWQVAPGSEKTNSLVFGIWLPDPPSSTTQALRAALMEAGIPFSTQTLPQQGNSVGFLSTTIPGAPTLMIGSRPPPILQQAGLTTHNIVTKTATVCLSLMSQSPVPLRPRFRRLA